MRPKLAIPSRQLVTENLSDYRDQRECHHAKFSSPSSSSSGGSPAQEAADSDEDSVYDVPQGFMLPGDAARQPTVSPPSSAGTSGPAAASPGDLNAALEGLLEHYDGESALDASFVAELVCTWLDAFDNWFSPKSSRPIIPILSGLLRGTFSGTTTTRKQTTVTSISSTKKVLQLATSSRRRQVCISTCTLQTLFIPCTFIQLNRYSR